jgi:hypothetical protein
MSDHQPYERPAPQVPVVDQFIVGFGETTFAGDAATARRNVETALATLLNALPATLLRKFVAVSHNKAYFAIAVIRLDGPDQTLAALQKEVDSGKEGNKPGYAHIEWVEQNAPIAMAVLLDDPLLPQQWALTTLGADNVWTVGPPPVPPAGSTIVAIVDSGLQLPGGGVHADMGLVVPVADWQPVLVPPFFDTIDMDGHGTLLAGTIAAVPDNATGVGSAVPDTWNIRLMPVKFFSPVIPPNAADATIAMVHAATHFFDQAGNNPVRVINASWRVSPGDAGLASLRAATTIASNFGCLVVFAAGNEGTDNGIYPAYPANFATEVAFQGKVLTVLATDRYDAKAFFSNYGSNTVDIGAPGLRILATNRYLVAPPRYSEYSGTSPAAAYVSAGAALVFALNPGWQPADVVQHLITSADVIQDLMIACIGGRRLNLSRAVYGPLQVVTPGAGAILVAGNPFNITWNVQYNNPRFNQVDIAFSNGGGPFVQLAAGVPIGVGAGAWMWPAPPVTVAPGGRIRITPTNGNFPAESGLFTAA